MFFCFRAYYSKQVLYLQGLQRIKGMIKYIQKTNQKREVRHMIIGIIGAMEEEVSILKETMEIEETVSYAGMDFCKGKLCGRDVVIVRSGIGKVNAAVCTQVLVDKFNVDVLINTGVAGSLDAKIDIGDMVISTDCVEHDMDTSVFGDPIGQVPRMDTFSFPADPVLEGKALAANEAANPDIKTFTGRIVSGDQFISSPEATSSIVSSLIFIIS